MPQNKYYGDTGVDQLDTGGNPIFTFLSSVLNDGEVLADDGRAYSSIQTAHDNASGFILIGPGSFDEAITANTADMSIVGSGEGTAIDNTGAGETIAVTAADVRIESVKLTNNAASQSINSAASGTVVTDVEFGFADDTHLQLQQPDSICTNSLFGDGGGRNIDPQNTRIIMDNCIMTGTPSSDTAQTKPNTNNILSNCVLKDGTDGTALTGAVRVQSDDNIVHGNRVISANDNGIQVTSSNDNIISKNRVSDSSGADISDGGTGTLLDDNETGTAN